MIGVVCNLAAELCTLIGQDALQDNLVLNKEGDQRSKT